MEGMGYPTGFLGFALFTCSVFAPSASLWTRGYMDWSEGSKKVGFSTWEVPGDSVFPFLGKASLSSWSQLQVPVSLMSSDGFG